MKITMLTQRNTTTVIAQSAHEALHLLLKQARFNEAVINGVQATRITQPEDAALRTAEFSEKSGAHVPGYFEGIINELKLVPAATSVWNVTVDAEWQVEYTNSADQGEQGGVVGSIGGEGLGKGEVTDPNDRAGMTISAPAGVTKQPSDTEPVT